MALIFLTKYIQEVHLHKEIGIVPRLMGRRHGYETMICCHQNPNKPLGENQDGVQLIPIREASWPIGPLSAVFENRHMIGWLIRHAQSVDVLVLLSFTRAYVVFASVYRFFNKRGIVFLKADVSEESIRTYLGKSRYIDNLKSLHRLSDLISVPTRAVYERLKAGYEKLGLDSRKLRVYPNGFDDSLIAGRHTWREKEKLILTVGRLGTEQKNTEMLLSALVSVDLKGWSVVLAGPVEESFASTLAEFRSKHPESSAALRLAGELTDREELYELYERASIFCLTSRWESFGIVLAEALHFDDYLISTKVGAANDLILEGVNGSLVDSEDSAAFAAALKRAMKEGPAPSGFVGNPDYREMKTRFLWSTIVDRMKNDLDACEKKHHG
jgi:glycosyltransferase involved in cell wall biosynthesis